jgi:hypothetical protein
MGINSDMKAGLKRSYIHEVQMMEVALRKDGRDRMWLASFDKCIAKDSSLNIDQETLQDLQTDFDPKIVHLPVLWKKHHSRLAEGRRRNRGAFWIAMIRDSTHERLEISRGKKQDHYGVGSGSTGWSQDWYETQTEIWDEDVFMDCKMGGEWLGGEAHWSQFAVL